jgi:protein HOOK3
LRWQQILTNCSKTENDDLRRELEKLKSGVPNAPVRTSELSKVTWNAYKKHTQPNAADFPTYSEQMVLAIELARSQSTERSFEDDSPWESTETNSVDSEEYWKLFDQFKLARKNHAEAEKKLATTERELADSQRQRESMATSLVQSLDQYADYVKVGLVSKEKLDIVNEIKESNSAELGKVRAQWDDLQNRLRYLEAELDVNMVLVREITSERDALLLKLSGEAPARDPETSAEMQKLLDEFNARAQDTSDAPEKSGNELLKQFAELTERSAEKLAKREEVSRLLSVPSSNASIQSFRDKSPDTLVFSSRSVARPAHLGPLPYSRPVQKAPSSSTTRGRHFFWSKSEKKEPSYFGKKYY